MIEVPKQKKTGIPLLGLGTWDLFGDECTKIVAKALELGYRHIDTADIYGNHREIAKSIKIFPREELFITSKLWTDNLSPDRVRSETPRMLEELSVDYLDLLLIHWPNPDVDMNLTLEAMVGLKEQGLIRNLGVSNFVSFHLNEFALTFPILTNQFEMHPYFQRKKLVDACIKNGVSVTAYRPLAKGAELLHDNVLIEIANKHNKTPAQVTLRWFIQQDISAIPKAANEKHLEDNITIFDFTLDKEDMKKIRGLNADKRLCDPGGVAVYED